MELFSETGQSSPKSIILSNFSSLEESFFQEPSFVECLERVIAGERKKIKIGLLNLERVIAGERKKLKIGLLKYSPENIKQLLDLQKTKIEELQHSGNESFLVKKTEEEFSKLTNLKDGITVVAIDEESGRVVAQTSISFENLKDEKCDVFAGTDLIPYFPKSLTKSGSLAYIFENRGTIVDSKFNGVSLSRDLINFAIDLLKSFFGENKVLLLSEIHEKNEANLHVKSKEGFKALQKYKASDGVECYLFYKPIGQELSEELKFDSVESLYKSERVAKKATEPEKFTSHVEKLQSQRDGEKSKCVDGGVKLC